MADIIVNEKFRTLIPPLNKAEYTELEKSLKKKAVASLWLHGTGISLTVIIVLRSAPA